jgi:GTP-binding protein
MIIRKAEFFKSSPDISQCPKNKLPEFAFIGRSNVGKSSLINMLTGKENLAKTSSTPGKTQLINHFLINDNWFLVDLPGYGYAKSSKKSREKWLKMTENYFIKRENLYSTFVLIDSRIPPQTIDLEFIEWMGINNLPFSIVFTKIDKAKNKDSAKNINDFKLSLSENWEELPLIFLSSSKTAYGKENILNYISEVIETVKI